MKTAVIIVGHGSKSAGADEAIKRVASELAQTGGFHRVQYAFLQYTASEPGSVVRQCIEAGAERIVLVPFFLQPGTHVIRDIPQLVEEARKNHPGTLFQVTDYAGNHSLMARIVLDLVEKSK